MLSVLIWLVYLQVRLLGDPGGVSQHQSVVEEVCRWWWMMMEMMMHGVEDMCHEFGDEAKVAAKASTMRLLALFVAC
jgi:hypothetical protein